MAPIKIYPPAKLPEKGVTDMLFNVWVEELEVYLGQDDTLSVFMDGGAYAEWQAYDANADRINQPQGEDAIAQLPLRRRQLRTFLSIIAKSCDINHYNIVTRHSTSLQWIYTKLREDYDIQQKGIHFFNLLDLKFQPGTNVVGFYNQYRNLVIANLKKRGDTIHWQNAELQQDEKLTPTFEDTILLNVLTLIDTRLPTHVRDHYHHHMGRDKSLMDFKTDILIKTPVFISELDTKLQNSTIHSADVDDVSEQLCGMRFQHNFRQRGSDYRYAGRGRPFMRARGQPRGGFAVAPMTRQQAFSTPYCRICHLTGQPDSVVRSHRIGDMACPKLSMADKTYIQQQRDQPRVNAVLADDSAELLADVYGYEDHDVDQLHQEDQVRQPQPINPPEHQSAPSPDLLTANCSRILSTAMQPSCNVIHPVPSHILTVFTEDKQVINIELDSNATVNYIKLAAAQHFKFKISPNSQLSTLADGITKLPAVGEITETFFRNEWQVQFKAVVVKTLHTDFIGGTVFLQDNAVQQDFKTNTILVHSKFRVPATNPAVIMPIIPQNHLCKISCSRTLLPNQSIHLSVPFPDNHVVAVESCQQQSDADWPEPQLCKVYEGRINISNTSEQPILLGKDIKVIQIRPTTNISQPTELSLPQATNKPTNSLPDISMQIEAIPVDAAAIIQAAHTTYATVFNKDLRTGYNGAFGQHVCRLNWAGDTRPAASQVRMVSYSHDLKQLHQAVCDELTHQGVLGIPQEAGINVQFVCPSFLRRKPKAKSKPNHLLTKDDVRLVVNFSPVNDHLKNIPSVKTTPNDILVTIGRWKHIIIFDLHQGFFQNHMHQDDTKWLGVATPFGGIRFLKRSGQGLLGQSEELEELLTKILKDELHAGSCCKIADDIFVGGQTHQQAATTYASILAKLHAANLKIAGSKTHIFPHSADILGWVWKTGGRLLPSPHRQLALKNTKQEDLVIIKDLRSWIGLYKTLLIATPHLATIMDPFDKETAAKDSRDKITLTSQLAHAFREAKNHIDNIRELYLPAPDDQLLLVPDGSQKTPGIGHVLYAIVNGQRKPVRFHSVKLPENCTKWSPCEIEALAFATGIQAELDLIKESTKPLLIAPDSSPVKDAVNLIKKGKFSASARMNAFITNINRVPVEVIHASGKANLNAVGDMQSRNPSSCATQNCTICTFVSNCIDTVLRPNATLGAISLYNTNSWAVAQKQNAACRTALEHLKTGKQPSKKSGTIFSEIRRYCAVAKIGKDGCLTIPPLPSFSATPQRPKIVIPTPLLPSLLWNIHNTENHPSKSQLRNIFDGMFYGIMVQQHIDKLYDDCYQCKLTKQLPKINNHHSQCTPVDHPGCYFHADVIKRSKQKILIMRDQFSSLTTATLVPSEQAEDLKNAIILLTTPIRMATNITIRVDAATAFQALAKDKDLADLGIKIELGDVHNKNSNAVVDKACAELEEELTKLHPSAEQLLPTSVAKATLLLNKKIRRKDKLTAQEIHFSRDHVTQQNLLLDDVAIRNSQLNNRQLVEPVKPEHLPQTGDTVVTINKPSKHNARDVFIVTNATPQAVTMQKLDNLFSPTTTLRSKLHTTSPKLLHTIHRAYQLPQQISDNTPARLPLTKSTPAWSPISPAYYQQQLDPDEEEATEDQQLIIPPMQDWLQAQRQAAAAARREGHNALAAYIPPPPPPPPRQAKVAAIQALAQLTAKPKKQPAIPQVEGAEPTPETSPDSSLLINQLSPREPWSPLPSYQDFQESDFLPPDYDHWAAFSNWLPEELPLHDTYQWPSTSTIWSGEERLSLLWDDPQCPPEQLLDIPLLQFRPIQPPQQQIIDQRHVEEDHISGTRRQVNRNRRASFGGFHITPFPKRIKISEPDYSVWQSNNNNYPL